MSPFLSYLAVERKVSASTQNQALSAILLLYRKVLKIELGSLDDLVHARRPARLPIVLTRAELAAIELLGHRDVRTTMIYTHVLNRGGRGVRSPLDR